MRGMNQKYANSVPSLVQLFVSFLRLGATSFGGPAMIAYIRKMAVEQKQWLNEEIFRDGVALCQTIPGATAMQMAAYVGLRIRRVAGAAVSFIGFGLPAFLFMMTLSALYSQTQTIPAVVSAFDGLRAIIVSIVANATFLFARTTLKNYKNATIAIIAAGMFGFQINPILVIIFAALLGILFNNKKVATNPKFHSVEESPSVKPIFLLLSLAAIGIVILFITQRKLFDLAALMLRIDMFAYGGGFAAVPIMFHEIVEVRSWMDSSTFLNGIILGQVTPGPIVITATFVGYFTNGPLGGLIATISIFLPSFIILVGIMPYFDRFRASPYFNKAIIGIFCSFVGLLLTVTIRFGLNVHWDFPRIILAVAAMVALLAKVDIFWVVLAGTAISVFVL